MYKINSKIFTVFVHLGLIILLFASNYNTIMAANKYRKPQSPAKVPAATLVMNLSNNKIIFAANHHGKIYPASLGKLMTLHILFSELQKGSISMSTKFTVSVNATKRPQSKLNLVAGDKITVRDAILALIVKSANDVAVTVAENISGSEEKFSKKMTIEARKIGMRNTNFKNASGLHHKDQYSSAYDMLKLTKSLRKNFPQHYHFFSQTSFSYKGVTINGHNKLTSNYHGAEGLKTGYTSKSGFNLITVAKRNGQSIVGIVVGESSSQSRDNKMQKLLDKAFSGIKPQNYNVAKANYSISKPKSVQSTMIASKAITTHKDNIILKYINKVKIIKV
ncbi:MAG: D-alanyl-D-alanine carboxypeptidase, partial [Rickettsiaceae bacterium]|nr:D-alanyl-D-alanine carboxypeptidase [Rickettsiaceae bacterium]